MRDAYSREYTELRNAPHFIFNGKHTRDFYVSNVQVDSGLAKDTFLATRNPIIERTRYSEKSYLLGINEEPIRFKIRLLFEEHKLKVPNLQGLKRWLKTDTFKEFRFDSENESNPTILMYAMVINTSEVSHNVIDDGYVDLEFETSSSVKYSEIMEDEVDLTKSAADKIAYNFKKQFNSLTTTHKNLASKLKQYVTRTNYAGLNKYFEDNDNNEIPDGWSITGGSQSGLSIDGTRLSINNVKLRKNLNLINGRNYYLNVEGLNGKVGIHGDNLDINTMGTHVFKYRRNLLGNKGSFNIDNNNDGVTDGWSKPVVNPNLINKSYNKLNLWGGNNVGLGTASLDGEWVKYTADAGKTISLYSGSLLAPAMLDSPLENGKTYTLSYTLKVPANQTVTYYITNTPETTSKTIPASPIEKIIYMTITFTRNTSVNQNPLIYSSGTNVWIKDMKIEAGAQSTYEGAYSINKTLGQQTINTFGSLTTNATLIQGLKYVLIHETPTFVSKIKVNGILYDSSKRGNTHFYPFVSNGDSQITLYSNNESAIIYNKLRLHLLTDAEYELLTSIKDTKENFVNELDYTSSNTYQEIVKTSELFSETKLPIWKATKLATGSPPIHIQGNSILVKPNENITFSMWVKQEATNTNDVSFSLTLYNQVETKIEATTNSSDKTNTWKRYAITYNNYSGVSKEISPYFYISRGTGNITYFTSPQVEFNSSVTEYKLNNYNLLASDYPFFGSTPYLELDFTGAEGYVDYFNLYELSDLDKSRIDSGTSFDDIVGVDYQEYIKMLNGYKTRIQPLVNELTAYGDELNRDPSGIFTGIYREILELSKRIEALLIKLNREDDDSLFEWEDIQPDYNEIMNILKTFDDLANRTAQLTVVNKATIENSNTFNQDVVEIYNQGDAEIYPTFYLKSLDGSNITITNLDTNESTTITNNIAGEEITMIGESERILTSRPAPYYKYDSHDDVFIGLQVGHNALKFTGNLTVKIIYQFKYL